MAVFVVGVDENGLGPRLGPLVATAVALDVAAYRAEPFYVLGERLGIRDSKAMSGFGKMAGVEGVALALVDRLFGDIPQDADALLHWLSVDPLPQLRAPCPASSAPQCWSASLTLPAFGGDAAEGHRALEQLDRSGIRVELAKSAVVCTRIFNAEVGRLGSKLALDLSLFERLLIDVRGRLGSDIEAFCGMVGGIRRYRERFQELPPSAVEVVGEGRGGSMYRVAGLGLVAFEVDADARHLPVALASMVGKYVREVAMERQNRFYLAREPSLKRVSGYNDPLTARFIEQSSGLRHRLGIAAECFIRAR